MRTLDPALVVPFRHKDTYSSKFQRPDALTADDMQAAIDEAMKAGGRELMQAVCGVYVVVQKRDRRVYVGRSVNMKARMQVHFSQLRNGRHLNTHMQRDFAEVGESGFGCAPLTLSAGAWTFLCELAALKLVRELDNYNIANVDYIGRACLGPSAMARLSSETAEKAMARAAEWRV